MYSPFLAEISGGSKSVLRQLRGTPANSSACVLLGNGRSLAFGGGFGGLWLDSSEQAAGLPLALAAGTSGNTAEVSLPARHTGKQVWG